MTKTVVIAGGRGLCPQLPPRLAVYRVLAVQLEVDLQHVDPRLAHEPERPSVLVIADHGTHLIGADATGLGYPRDLKVGVGDGDVRVEAAAAGRDRVGGHGRVRGCGPADGHDLAH